MANPSAAHEPSMEEILASIRQIISEDTDRTVPATKSDKARSSKDAAPSVPSASPAASEIGSAAAPINAAAVPPVAQPSAPAAKSPAKSETPAARTAPVPSSIPATATSGESSKAPLHNPSEQRHDPVDTARASTAADAPSDTGKLLSEHSKAAVESAFGALAHTILAQNARTLEDIVADMMRPMLKTWLDTNLPSLVERLVREEIERVSRGRR